MSNTGTKMKWAKIAGALYFIILGLLSIVVTYMNSHLTWRDFVLLAFLCTPLIVNKKLYYLIFGGLFTILSLFVLYKVFDTQTLHVRGVYEFKNRHFSPATAFTLGYTFAIVSTFFSYLLLRVGLKDSKE